MKKIVDKIYENPYKKSIALLLIYTIFLLWGLFSYKDYGVSYDEVVQRRHGLVNFKYVYELVNGSENMPEYLNKIPYTLEEYDFMKYYGVGIKIPLVLIEWLSDFTMTNQQIYHMNHLYTFLLFFTASIFVYKIMQLLGFSFGYSIFAVLIFMACPRILADSFYNIKDSVFSSLFIMMLYFGLATIKEFSWKSGLGLAISAAFCLNTRIVGALPLAVIIIAYLFYGEKIDWIKIRKLFITGLGSFMIYILIAPAAWSNIFEYLYNVINVFSDFDQAGTVLIAGQKYMTENLPWYYLLLCIVLTMPSLYIVFCVLGLIEKGKEFLITKNIRDNYFILILFIQFIVILLYDIVNRPSKYNMWRHFHFLFIYIVIFTVLGIQYALEHYKKYQVIIKSFIGISIFLTICWIIRNHPYEYLYFNPLFHGGLADNTEQDYWMITSHDILQGIEEDNIIDVYVELDASVDAKAIFFGEDKWEKYHINKEKDGTEYKLYSGETEDNVVYGIENVFKIENRNIITLLKRKNYDNCVLKYYYNDSIVTGNNYKTEIQWSYAVDGKDRCLMAYIPDSYNIYEFDFISSVKDKVTNVRAYVSDTGSEWYTLEETKHIYQSKDIFAVVSDNAMPQYVMIKYEIKESETVENDPEFLIRVFGEKSAKLAYVSSNYNSDYLVFLCDDDINSRWDSGEYSKSGMYVEFGLWQKETVTGISLKLGSSVYDYSRDLLIQGKDDEGNWINIKYTCDNNEDYVFDEPVRYSDFRVINMTDTDFAFWSIHELKVWIKDSEIKWNYQDSCDSIMGMQSEYNPAVLGQMLDNDLYSSWYSGGSQNDSMYIDIEMKPDNKIKGFHIDSGIYYIESARSLRILGSYDGETWNEITYHYASASDYVFDRYCDYNFYRLWQTGNDDVYGWVIAELGVLK